VDDVQRYQWDLDYTNPRSSGAMAEVVLGSPAAASTCCGSTPCRSCGSGSARLPEPARGPRAAAGAARGRRIARPAVGFKAEAIVSPRDLVVPRARPHEGKECDLAYHNVLMALLWSALAPGAWR
jgi:amylosucrase